MAKRVPERVAVLSQMLPLSADQVSAMVQGVKLQMKSDTMWRGKIVEALNDHGDALDKQPESIKQLTGIQENMGAFALDIQQEFAELSQKMRNDDALIRASLNDNDMNQKDEINSNNIDVREVIAAQDAITTNALQSMNAKIDKAMHENVRVQTIVESSASEWNQSVVTVEQHCSTAAAAIEEVKTNMVKDIKGLAGLAGRIS